MWLMKCVTCGHEVKISDIVMKVHSKSYLPLYCPICNSENSLTKIKYVRGR